MQFKLTTALVVLAAAAASATPSPAVKEHRGKIQLTQESINNAYYGPGASSVKPTVNNQVVNFSTGTQMSPAGDVKADWWFCPYYGGYWCPDWTWYCTDLHPWTCFY